MMFPTQYDRLRSDFKRQRVLSRIGNPILQKYRPEYDKQGNLQLIPDGETDLYAEIQSHKASTDLELIVTRYLNGDPAALSRAQGLYMDITGMPSNMHEAINLMNQAKADFEKLPVDIKQQFDNDYNKFIATMGTQEWLDKMQVVKEEVSNESQPEQPVRQSAEG